MSLSPAEEGRVQAESLWHWLMVEGPPPETRPGPRWIKAARAALAGCLEAYAARDGEGPDDDPRLCRLALAAHDLRQEARAAAGALVTDAASRTVDDPLAAEEALALLPPLENADLFLTALLLLWTEADRWLSSPREARRIQDARSIVEHLDRHLPAGPFDGGSFLAPELVARAFRRIEEALPGLDLSALWARLPEAREILEAEAAPEDDGLDGLFPAEAAAPVPVPAGPGAAEKVEQDVTDFALRRPRGEHWTSQHVTSLVLRALGLPPPARTRLFERALAIAAAFARDDEGWWTSRVLVDAARCLAHLPGSIDSLFATLHRASETVRHEPYRFEVLEETAVALAAHAREDEARSCLEEITDDHHLAGAANRAACAMAAAAKPAAAERLFRWALERARRATAAGRPSREAEVLRALASCGWPAAARLAALSFPDRTRRARALSEVAAALLDRAAPVEAFRSLVLLLTSSRLSPVLDSDALARVARGLAAAGQAARARKLLTRALAAASALPDPEAREQHLKTLSAVGLEPAVLGGTTALLRTVLKTARAIEDPFRRENVLAAIAGSLVQAGRSDAALALEADFSSPWRKARLFAGVGEAAIAAGDVSRGATLLDRALDRLEGHFPSAGSIPTQAAFLPAFFAVPDPVLRRPLLLRAIEQVAAACEMDTTRAYAVRHLGQRLAEADRDGCHGDLLAGAAVHCDKAEMPSEAIDVRIEAARLFARAGDARQAQATAERLRSRKGYHDKAFAAAVAGFADSGHHDQALEALSWIETPYARDRALLALASSLAVLPTEQRPAGLVDRLLEIARGVSDVEKRAEATMILAPLLPPAEAARNEEALAGVEKEMYTAGTREARMSLLAGLVAAWIARGDPQRAFAVLCRADAGEMGVQALAALCRTAPPAALVALTGSLRELLEDFAEPRARVEGLVELARVLARSARPDEAVRTLSDAAAALRGIEDPSGRRFAVEKITQCLDEEALAGPADLYRALLTAAGSLPSAWDQGEAVAAVARALARQPQVDADLFSVLEETLASMPVRRRFVQALRTALLAVNPAPRPFLRRTLTLFPLEPGLAPEGVQCLAAAHLQAGDTVAFEAIVEACPGILKGQPARVLPG